MKRCIPIISLSFICIFLTVQLSIPVSFAQEETVFRPESIPPEIGIRMEYFLTQEQYDLCMTDLEKTIVKKKVWDQSSYLSFIKRRTNGAVDQKVLDSNILDLVYIYWFVICTTVGADACLDINWVTSTQVTNFYFSNGEPLTEEICERMQYYLDQQQQEQDMNQMPSKAPSESPTNMLEIRISESPTEAPPTALPTIQPVTVPSAAPSATSSTTSPSSSNTISLAPTFTSMMKNLTFPIYYAMNHNPNYNATNDNSTDTTTTRCLQNFLQDYITMELQTILGCQTIGEEPKDDDDPSSASSSSSRCAFDTLQVSILEFFSFECIKEPFPSSLQSLSLNHTNKFMCALVTMRLTLQRMNNMSYIHQDTLLLPNILSDAVTVIINQDSFQSAILNGGCEKK